MYRVGETVVEKFALRDPATGNRLTSGTFTALAHDPNGADISSQIVVSADSAALGIWQYSFVAAVAGMYLVSVYESTTQQYIDSDFQVGGDIANRIWSLSNQGQPVSLGPGGGGVTYNGTITLSGVPQANVFLRCFRAQDTNGTDANAVVDISSVVAQTTTDGSGQFSLSLTASYFAIQYFLGTTSYSTYIRWSQNRGTWVTSTSPISVWQL